MLSSSSSSSQAAASSRTKSKCIFLIASCLLSLHLCEGFFLPPVSKETCSFLTSAQRRSSPASLVSSMSSSSDSGQTTKKAKVPKGKPVMTIADLAKQVEQNPAKYLKDGRQQQQQQQQQKLQPKKKKKRTRARVENPKQEYLYKAQREQKAKSGVLPTGEVDELAVEAATITTTDAQTTKKTKNDSIIKAQTEFGLMPLAQHCDIVLDNAQPKILGKVRVVDDDDEGEDGGKSGSFAYLIDKPAGWSILGSNTENLKQKNKKQQQSKERKEPANNQNDDDMDGDGDDEIGASSSDGGVDLKKKARKNYQRTVKVQDDEDGSVEIFTYNELDIMALLTPEELEEYLEEHKDELGDVATGPAKKRMVPSSSGSSTDHDTAHSDDNNGDDHDHNVEGELVGTLEQTQKHSKPLDPATEANLQRIAARLKALENNDGARFAQISRPSIITWLKQHIMETTGNPIRGGNFWIAVAGATQVDDSGLVLLCPRKKVDKVFVDFCEYVAVVGNGGDMAPPDATTSTAKKGPNSLETSSQKIEMDLMAKVRKGRGDDPVQVVKVRVVEGASTSSQVVEACQDQFEDGIRGDPAANPLDRRARRRLVHCRSIAVASLVSDDSAEAQLSELPDDIAVLAERRNHLEYNSGSFLGRSLLRKNKETTNAYREINGAADGFVGWTVDRYASWLFVQHDPKHPRGPLPSIHDGNTLGVYYLASDPDRTAMGTSDELRPVLLEGKPAPDVFPIVENGVKYLVSLNKDLSTGIFLDQRPQRAWLVRNCCSETRVLNCFAHTAAFSVAAASAGASTVSIDLSKKWLDRFPQHLEANGIEFDERHDCIYGDCFDWLARLAKRGEKYDIVILDPPSASVGGRKKKRWSVKNDMDELVALGATLVKKGGLLWTTTNSASISSLKFARLCRKGLDDAGVESAKLERIQPMPSDFQTIGPQPVKNLVWRIN